MNGSAPESAWRPRYPRRKEESVRLVDCELQTFASDRRPGISVVDVELDRPACFWIAPEHVYLRANWGLWCTVALSNPDHVSALCAARRCRIAHSMDNTLRELTAPVFHVEELPRELFAPETGGGESDPGDPEPEGRRAPFRLPELPPLDADDI